jgi:starch-binding outer membrane protein, SusD/RagB family
MKSKIYPFICFFFMCSVFSCNEESYLTEDALDFYTTENAYVSLSQFQSSVYKLYDRVRYEFYTSNEDRPFDFFYGTDLAHSGEYLSSARFENYSIQLDPTANAPLSHWSNLYKIIADANVILNRCESAALTTENKTLIEAQAKFFRAFAYRTLAYLYGGVPIELDEVTIPRTDYVRASRTEVYQQAIEDLVFSANNLPAITAVKDGEISNLAAYHLLAEVYLADGQYKNAIDAASVVINDANMSLMKERFGTLKSEAGDVYWDLFRGGNQNRASGNKEAIWVIQFELDVPGGSMSSTGRTGYVMERHHPPLFRDTKRPDNAAKTAGFQWPTSDYTGGRGIGWMIPTYYFTNTIWASDFNNDVRNSKYNFPRKFMFNNSSVSEFQGVEFDAETNPEAVASLTNKGTWPRNIYPYQTKCTTPGHHPTNLFSNISKLLLSGNAGTTYTDQYMFRLAETYLIRAEAYLGNNDPSNAAADINVVRARANASPVDAAMVDINYILDERMRELGIEEKRRLTLARLGMVYSRTVAHNPYNADDIMDYNNLFPIPYSEIERNTQAKLEQNPGYSQ